MKVYLAGEREMFAADAPEHTARMASVVKRRLFSFYYHGFSGGKSSIKVQDDGLTFDIKASSQASMDMFLDSGAFTAFTQNINMSLEEYAAFLRKHGELFSAISNLDDTNKNEQKSYDNQKWLEAHGCMVQPVFHCREDYRWLVKYLDEGYDYIFLGGMVPETTKWLKGWLDVIWDTYLTNPDGTPRVKIHGFGLTTQDLMFRYPWFSVDSTSWLMTGIFGSCFVRLKDGRVRKVVFSEESPQARNAEGWHYKALKRSERALIDEALEPYGVTAEQCGQHYSYRDVINAAVFQSFEDMGCEKFKREQGGLFE